MLEKPNVMTKNKRETVVFRVLVERWAETVINKTYLLLGVF
jgi:hypothetical protein